MTNDNSQDLFEDFSKDLSLFRRIQLKMNIHI